MVVSDRLWSFCATSERSRRSKTKLNYNHGVGYLFNDRVHQICLMCRGFKAAATFASKIVQPSSNDIGNLWQIQSDMLLIWQLSPGRKWKCLPYMWCVCVLHMHWRCAYLYNCNSQTHSNKMEVWGCRYSCGRRSIRVPQDSNAQQ